MKSPILLSAIFIAFLFSLIFFSSCNATKKTAEEKVSLILLLKARQGPDYITENYASYKPTDIKRSNRTLNQYRVNFTCKEKAKSQLMQDLEADEKVIKFSIADQSGIDIQSGTNQHSSKTKPGNKN